MNGEVKLLCKFKKKCLFVVFFFLGGGGRVWGGGGGFQGGCEWRSEAFVKIIQKKKKIGGVGGRVRGGRVGGSGSMGMEK